MVSFALPLTMAKIGAKVGGRLGPKGVAIGGVAGLTAGIAIQNGGLRKARQFLERQDLETRHVESILDGIEDLDAVDSPSGSGSGTGETRSGDDGPPRRPT